MEHLDLVRELLGDRVASEATVSMSDLEIVQIREVGTGACRVACLVIDDMELDERISTRSAPLGSMVGRDYRSDWRGALGDRMAKRLDAQLARWSKVAPLAEVAVSRLSGPVVRVSWSGGRAWLLPQSRSVLATTGSDRTTWARSPGVPTDMSLIPMAIVLLAAVGVVAAAIAGVGVSGRHTVDAIAIICGSGLGLVCALLARRDMRRGLAMAYADEPVETPPKQPPPQQ